MIRIYGHWQGESSFVQVTRGMRTAAAAAQLLAGEVAVDDTSIEHSVAGADALVALHCGAPLSVVLGHRQGVHRRHWLLLAPNSEGVPPRLVAQLQEHVLSLVPGKSQPEQRPLLDGFLAPSEWARQVLSRAFPHHRVLCAPHGVHPDVHRPDPRQYAQNAREYTAGQFRVLHITSTLGQRKGTQELLVAWQRWQKRGAPPKARLVIISHPVAMAALMEQVRTLEIAGSVSVFAQLNLPVAELTAMLRFAHLVCQPSRGEGFGLVPLEARACGVPVVATACTGHTEHMQTGTPGVTVVAHGPLGPIDDYPGALAPTVSSDDVCEALDRAYARWPELASEAQASADAVRSEWSWQKKIEGVLRYLIDECR